jgi:hypothetical protein
VVEVEVKNNRQNQEEKGRLCYIILINGSMFQGREKKDTLFSWAFQSHQETMSTGKGS